MRLHAYWKTLTPTEKADYAAAAGTTAGYVKQLTGGHAKPGPSLARKLAKASRGKVRLSDLRPDIWPAAGKH